jgi:hypothetical protein
MTGQQGASFPYFTSPARGKRSRRRCPALPRPDPAPRQLSLPLAGEGFSITDLAEVHALAGPRHPLRPLLRTREPWLGVTAR